jgi:rRNA maturation endonuclease Nob1
MGLLSRLRDLVSLPAVDRESDEPAYRCIKCGEGYERDVSTCAACGGQFVAPVDGGDESS